MKITLKRTEDQLELVKAMASRNRETAFKAQSLAGELMGPVVSKVIDNAPTISNLFQTETFNSKDNPSLPLDLFYDVQDEDYVRVYSSSVAGGLPSNNVLPTESELKFQTYDLDSAYSFNKKYAAESRLDVVGKVFTRVMQEVLRKQERTSANILLTAAANATSGNYAFTARNRNIFRTAQANRFLLDDLNKLFTKGKRINSSFLGGTPVASRKGLTDLLVSPEVTEQIRAMAYNPINTVGADGAAAGNDSGVVTLTEEQRRGIFSQAGLTEFMGLAITEINELGIGKLFNDIFDTLAGTTDFLNHGSTSASSAFNGATEELILGLDRTRDSLVRMVAVDEEVGGSFILTPDDQFSNRQKRVGFYGEMSEARAVIDNRVLMGLIM